MHIIAFHICSHARCVTIFRTPECMAELRRRLVCREISSDFEFVAHDLRLQLLTTCTPLRIPITEGTSFLPWTRLIRTSSHLASKWAPSRQRDSGPQTARTAKSDTSLTHTPIHETPESWCSSKKATFFQQLVR